MERVELDGSEAEFEIHGSGDPAVLIEAPPFLAWYHPFLRFCPAGRCFGTAALRRPGFGVEDDARLCARLLTHVRFVRPHVVGHSYGGIVALELARQRSIDMRSLALLEPAPAGLSAPETAAAQMAPLLRMARDNGAVAAMEHFLRGACGGLEPRGSNSSYLGPFMTRRCTRRVSSTASCPRPSGGRSRRRTPDF